MLNRFEFEARVANFGDALVLLREHEVDCTESEIPHGVVVLCLDDVEGHPFGERGETGNDDRRQRRGEAGDHEVRQLVGVVDDVASAGVEVDHVERYREERGSGVGQPEAASGPVEEVDAELVLEFGQVLGDGRCREVECRGGGSNGAALGDFSEGTKANQNEHERRR